MLPFWAEKRTQRMSCMHKYSWAFLPLLERKIHRFAFSGVLLGLIAAVLPVLSTAWVPLYHGVSGSLCVTPQFTETQQHAAGLIGCAALCSSDPRCRAFSTEDGPCRLFVFDKCSKSVRDCGCSRRGRLFVKQQPGLESGALCPSDYGDDLCGVKYKMLTSVAAWDAQKKKCESDDGMAMMADMTDAAEMSHVDQLFAMYGSAAFHLDGRQTPGSAEPAGGWHWVTCNIAVNGSLWGASEPDNGASGTEDAIMRDASHSGLSDVGAAVQKRGLCECLSPFI